MFEHKAPGITWDVSDMQQNLHSLSTSSLILIRTRRPEGDGCGTQGHVPPLCVCWLIVLSWQEEGEANGRRTRDQEEAIKAPCFL